MRWILSRLRIPIGVVMLLIGASLQAEPRYLFQQPNATAMPGVGVQLAQVLPYFNVGGFESYIVYTNPTDTEIVLRQYSATLREVIPAHEQRSERVTQDGIGIGIVEADERLIVETYIWSPAGGWIIVPPLEPLGEARAYGLRQGGGYNSGLLLASFGETRVLVGGVGGIDVVLPGNGQGTISPATGTVTKVSTDLGFGLFGADVFYGFGYTNHKNGALTFIRLRP
jgi:hypothetical protein